MVLLVTQTEEKEVLLRDEVGCTEPVFGKQELKILDLQPLVAACKAEIAVYVRQWRRSAGSRFDIFVCATATQRQQWVLQIL